MDPHVVLGVGVSATEAEIRRAFRRLALQHHPDRNAGSAVAAARFREVKAAYDALRDRARDARPRPPTETTETTETARTARTAKAGDGRHRRDLDPDRVERVRRRLQTLNDALRTTIARPTHDALEALIDVARWARLDVDDALALKGHVADLRDAAWKDLAFTTKTKSIEIFRAFIDAQTASLDLVEMRNLRARLDGLLSVARGFVSDVQRAS